MGDTKALVRALKMAREKELESERMLADAWATGMALVWALGKVRE